MIRVDDEESVVRRWDNAFAVMYGSGACFRCGQPFVKNEMFKVAFYWTAPTATTKVRKARLYHVEQCDVVDTKSGAVF